MTDVDTPDGWHWGGGGRSSTYYTHWLYSNLRYHYRAQVWWDDGGDHHVHFYEETGQRDDGDVRVSEYPCRRGSFDSEEAALEWAIETAEDLIDY